MILFYLTALYPLWRLRCANVRTSLKFVVYWTFAAWVSWGLLYFGPWVKGEPEAEFEIRYITLCLSACAGVAVLGARRPHAGAWNVVVGGLLAVMLQPLVEYRLLGTAMLMDLRVAFLGGVLFLMALNYLPTRLGGVAVLVSLACLMEWKEMLYLDWVRNSPPEVKPFVISLAAWVGVVCWRPQARSEFDTLWLDFRDRYGLFWGLRVRDQFNAAMANAGLTVWLSWSGLKPLPEAAPAAARETLRALLKRFLPTD